MSALKIGNVLRAGLMAWAMFMDLNVRSGDNYVNIGQSLVGTSGAVALADSKMNIICAVTRASNVSTTS